MGVGPIRKALDYVEQAVKSEADGYTWHENNQIYVLNLSQKELVEFCRLLKKIPNSPQTQNAADLLLLLEIGNGLLKDLVIYLKSKDFQDTLKQQLAKAEKKTKTNEVPAELRQINELFELSSALADEMVRLRRFLRDTDLKIAKNEMPDKKSSISNPLDRAFKA